MKLSEHHRAESLAAMILIAVLFFGWKLSGDGTELRLLALGHPILAGGLYVLLLIASVVLLPLSSIPLVPVAAALFGIVPAAILSIIGWWSGAVIAFMLARTIGRPLLRKVVSLESMDEWAKKIPNNVTFLGIVLLRMTTPVDIPSYVLGMIPSISFGTYAIASMIGIAPFAFVWALLGNSIASQQWWLAIVIALGLLAAVLCLKGMWKRGLVDNFLG